MSKVSFSNMKLKVQIPVKTVKIGDQEIEVKQYLPIEEKEDLIYATIEKSRDESGIFNKVKMEKNFYLNLIYLYTNIAFTDKQKEDESKLYDILESNGVINSILVHIPEYPDLMKTAEEAMKDILQYTTTAGSVIKSIINDLPNNAKAAADFVNSFDEEKFQNVKDMIQMAQNSGVNNGNIMPLPVK